MSETPLPLSVLELATVGSGQSTADALAPRSTVAQHRRPAGLPPALGGRAPQHAGDRQLPPAGADRPPGRGDQRDPGRLGRGDAAQPRAAGGRRAVRTAGGAAPRPDRPGHRPRARHRPAHRAGAAARPEGAVGRGLPAAARRPARPVRRRAGGGRPDRADHAPCPRAVPAAGRGCWAPAGSAPQLAGLLGLPFSFAHHFGSREHGRPRWRSTARRSAPRRCWSGRYAMVTVDTWSRGTDDEARRLRCPVS